MHCECFCCQNSRICEVNKCNGTGLCFLSELKWFAIWVTLPKIWSSGSYHVGQSKCRFKKLYALLCYYYFPHLYLVEFWYLNLVLYCLRLWACIFGLIIWSTLFFACLFVPFFVLFNIEFMAVTSALLLYFPYPSDEKFSNLNLCMKFATSWCSLLVVFTAEVEEPMISC